jgi:hypothetical protein
MYKSVSAPIIDHSAVCYRIADTSEVIWLERRGVNVLVIEDIPEDLLTAVRKTICDSVQKKQVRTIEDYLP